MAGGLLRKSVSLMFTWVFVTAFWFSSATSLMPTFGVYGKNGRSITNPAIEYILDPYNSVRFGVDVRPDMRIGFDSKHGLSIVVDF